MYPAFALLRPLVVALLSVGALALAPSPATANDLGGRCVVVEPIYVLGQMVVPETSRCVPFPGEQTAP
jgi:hypothetical protein